MSGNPTYQELTLPSSDRASVSRADLVIQRRYRGFVIVLGAGLRHIELGLAQFDDGTQPELVALLRDEPLLMAGVAGPFTLAARITGLQQGNSARREDFPDAALELAAATIMQIASKFVEAGANVIFIQEDFLPMLSAEYCEAWASLLAPAINIVRFYEALPVLQIMDSHSFAQNKQVIFQQNWDCVICPALAASAFSAWEMVPSSGFANLGIALSPEAFQPEASTVETFLELLHAFIRKSRAAIVTTAGDVAVATDLKFLARVREKATF